MKAIIGLILIVLGVVLGLYAGVWWAFVGGIVQVITEIRADEMNTMSLAWGIARILFCAVIGWISALILIFPGLALIKS